MTDHVSLCASGPEILWEVITALQQVSKLRIESSCIPL